MPQLNSRAVRNETCVELFDVLHVGCSGAGMDGPASGICGYEDISDPSAL